jgi:hypothetical protein
VTNRDKKDSIRGRMADTGEPFNVARRKVEAAAVGQAPEGEDPYQLIEVEVASGRLQNEGTHIETFWGRWILAPDPEKTRTVVPSRPPDDAYYGVAQTRRGRIAVYRGLDTPGLPWGELNDYDTLADAQLPVDIRRQVNAALGIQEEVIHRDI